jgi:hypothetical protein
MDAYAAIAPGVKESNCLFLNLNEAMLFLPFDMMMTESFSFESFELSFNFHNFEGLLH